MTVSQNTYLFPLIRHLSKRVTPFFINSPITANQITCSSLVSGLAAAWCAMKGNMFWDTAAGILLLIAYILDNCDGEVARIKKQCTTFGMQFDTFVDWVVHSSLFVGLGIGVALRFDNNLWFWLGVSASIGGTINYIIGLIIHAQEKPTSVSEDPLSSDEPNEDFNKPINFSDWFVYIFRELFRADFCFIFLALVIFEITWVLVIASAIGSQIYWILLFYKGAKDFHA